VAPVMRPDSVWIPARAADVISLHHGLQMGLGESTPANQNVRAPIGERTEGTIPCRNRGIGAFLDPFSSGCSVRT
jgi:hypothetical protein